MRSQKTPRKRQRQSELWDFHSRLPRDLEGPLRAKAAERGVTVQDEFELAVRAWLEIPVPDRYIPESRERLTGVDRVVMGMRCRNGDSFVSIARDYGITPRQARWICAKT